MRISPRRAVFIVRHGQNGQAVHAEIVRVNVNGAPTAAERSRLDHKYGTPKAMLRLDYFLHNSGDLINDLITL